MKNRTIPSICLRLLWRGIVIVQGLEKKLRGIYEVPVGSGIWKIQHFDTAGQRLREKVGRRSDAIDLSAKRMVEKLQRRKMPEKFWAKPVTLGELMDDALEHSQDENGVRSTAEPKLKYNILRPEFGSLAAEGITRSRVRDWLQNAKEERGWGPDATRNRWLAAFSPAFRVGTDNDKIRTNLIAKMKRKKRATLVFAFLTPKRRWPFGASWKRDSLNTLPILTSAFIQVRGQMNNSV